MEAMCPDQRSLGLTAGHDLYEVRPRKDRDGFDLISKLFRYGPIWYAGPDAVRNAIAYAKYRSHFRSHFNQYQSRLQIRNGIELFYRVHHSHLKALQNGRSKDP